MNIKKNIPENQGFKVPENYFGNFKERLDARLELGQLIGFEKDAGFKIPPSYFENNIISQPKLSRVIPLIVKIKSKTVPRMFYLSLATAAAVLLLLILKPFAQTTLDVSKIDALAIENYLEDVSLENIDYDVEWLIASENADLLLDGITTSQDNILDYLQHETDLMDLNLD